MMDADHLRVSDRLKTDESYPFENRSGCRDDVEHGFAPRNELGIDAGLERCEPVTVFYGKGQKRIIDEMLGPG